MVDKKFERRSFLKRAGTIAGSITIGSTAVSADEGRGEENRVERAESPTGYGPYVRPNADRSNAHRSDREIGTASHNFSYDIYVVCHKHAAAGWAYYDDVVQTLKDAADYHSSWRDFSIKVVDKGEDIPSGTPDFNCDSIYDYMRGNEGIYNTHHDVHFLVFDNPWNRVGRACGKVGWPYGQEDWSVAVEAVGFARLQSKPYMKTMACHEVGHTFIRAYGSNEWIDGHEAAGTEHNDSDEVYKIYSLSNTYVFDGNGNCDVNNLACKDPNDCPDEFVGCKPNFHGDGFASPFYRTLYWSNRRDHDGVWCYVGEPSSGDDDPGFTEDEIMLNVQENLR